MVVVFNQSGVRLRVKNVLGKWVCSLHQRSVLAIGDQHCLCVSPRAEEQLCRVSSARSQSRWSLSVFRGQSSNECKRNTKSQCKCIANQGLRGELSPRLRLYKLHISRRVRISNRNLTISFTLLIITIQLPYCHSA